MDIMTIRVACAFAFLILAGNINAQAVTIFDPFGLPTSSILVCRAIPVTEADSADVVLQFLDDGEQFRGRETVIAYDSSGSPLYVTVIASDSDEDVRGSSYGFLGRYRSVPSGAYGPILNQGIAENSTRLAPASTVPDFPPGWTVATGIQLDRAKNLAIDFWKRRCIARS